MSKSIAVFGAGPGLGQAVARRHAREGYEVVLVARRRESLERLAKDLGEDGATVHIVIADLADTAAISGLAGRISRIVGDDLDVLYYAPTPDAGFVPAAQLTAQRAREYMPLTFYSLVDLVERFLPGMINRGAGAVLTAQGASSVHGMPNMSGPGPAQAAQRNYLQSLHAELIDKGVYVGMLYVGALIEHSAFHAWTVTPEAAGQDWGPTVRPEDLADLLWNMAQQQGEAEASYPADILGR